MPDTSIAIIGPFELTGRPSNLLVRTQATVTNNWIYLDFDLVNVDSGERLSFGREVSYYRGVSGGESWSEGSRNDSALLPRIAAGRYVLRIFPTAPTAVNYTVTLRRDVTPRSLYGTVFVLLFLPPVLVSLRSKSFEVTRWAESDFPIIEVE